MSELRWNPQLREWVIVATHRQDRTYKPPAEYCPLCPTLPGAFPTEVPAEDYDIVVFENKFPSLTQPPPPLDVEGMGANPTMVEAPFSLTLEIPTLPKPTSWSALPNSASSPVPVSVFLCSMT